MPKIGLRTLTRLLRNQNLYLLLQLIEIHSFITEQFGEGFELFIVNNVSLPLIFKLLCITIDYPTVGVGNGPFLVDNGVAAIGRVDVACGFGEG